MVNVIEIKDFFTRLKESMENHARELKQGDLFLPEYLSGHALTRDVFPKISDTLASALNLEIVPEYHNDMPPPSEYKCGKFQRVDYFLHRGSEPNFFLELESLDRSQLNTFMEHENISEADNDNKLWYYYGTLVNNYTFGQSIPKYFVWLLILPDRQVEPYQIWDVTPDYKFFHPSLKKLVYQSPYRFYDPLIKSAARLFITRDYNFKHPGTKKWTKKRLVQFQDVCELVFITCTMDRLFMSRGKDIFSPEEEVSIGLNLGEGVNGK